MESGGSSNPRTPKAGSLNDPRESFKRSADQYMPIAHVARIMRRVLPPHAKIADDAKETIQECVSEFINFVTREANERCHAEYRKTISADDVLAAMGSLGFDNYVEPLTIYLDLHRDQDPERAHQAHPYARRGSRMPTNQMAPPLPAAANYGSNQGAGEGSSGTAAEHDLFE